jgi:DNA-binding response OmpR family regulator/HPt (histidine-containing phosphotransfer) domain-containing protein
MLRERFLASARASLERLHQYGVLLEADPHDAALLDTLRRELHRLRGSSGSYGYTAASERIGQMLQRAAAWALDPTLERDHRGAHVRHLVDALHTAFGQPADQPDDTEARTVWCVNPPAGRIAEWSRVAANSGLQFVPLTPDDFARRVQQRERPYAVIAPADVSRTLPVPGGWPLLLLATAGQTPTVGRAFSTVTVVDAELAADDLVVVIEQLAQRASGAGGSVLILDDDPTILLVARAIAERAGLRTVTIEAPDALWTALEDERPSVLLMDVQLPGTTGFELTRRLRASADWAELPIVLFSADASAEARENAVVAGADSFVPKPVAPAELRATLLAHIEQVRQDRLAHGLNPATALPEREAGLHAAEQLFGAMRRDGGPLSAAMVRLRDAADELHWPRTCALLARALRGTGAALAHYDRVSLVATVRDGYDPMLSALNALRAADPDGEGGRWVIGVAEAAAVGATSAVDLWHAASDAAAAAIALEQGHHEWTPADSTRAPDVIIVEDDPAFCDILEYALGQEGYTYKVLRTGPEALAYLRTVSVVSRKPLVLLDLDLPGLDGHAVHDHIRVGRPGDFVVVFLSAHSGDADQVRALRAGATDYLTKPLSLRVLLAKLPGWVRQPRSQP